MLFCEAYRVQSITEVLIFMHYTQQLSFRKHLKIKMKIMVLPLQCMLWLLRWILLMPWLLSWLLRKVMEKTLKDKILRKYLQMNPQVFFYRTI